MKNIERLSEMVMETLKELSAEQKSLTINSLYQAFASKDELLQLLSSPVEPPKGVKIQEMTPEKQIQGLKSDLRGLQAREQRLRKVAADLEELNSELKNFSKQSILTLLVMARHAENEALLAGIEEFRSAILNDANLEIQRECLRKVKSTILREEPSALYPDTGRPKCSPDQSPVPKVSASSAGISDQSRPCLSRLKESFLKTLDQLESECDEGAAPNFPELRQGLMACDSMETLAACGVDLLSRAREYVVQITDERSQMAGFIKEVGKSLVGMEQQILSSFFDTRATYLADKEFNSALEGEMDDLRESFHFGKTIEETLGFVTSKLEKIKNALLNKREKDDLRFQNANKKMNELQKNLDGMKSKIGRVQKRTKALEQEILLDPLTGIHNRRAYERRIQEELNRYQRYNQCFSLVILDVDHFKQVNDTYGHSAGDKCLREIINRVKVCIRGTDFLARYGGEEFVIIFVGVSKENACKAAEKIRVMIERTRFHYKKQEMPVTISLGVTDVRPEDKQPEELFARADAAMYKAKKEGRNRVCML